MNRKFRIRWLNLALLQMDWDFDWISDSGGNPGMGYATGRVKTKISAGRSLK
jgi:hypothetical protein